MHDKYVLFTSAWIDSYNINGQAFPFSSPSNTLYTYTYFHLALYHADISSSQVTHSQFSHSTYPIAPKSKSKLTQGSLGQPHPHALTISTSSLFTLLSHLHDKPCSVLHSSPLPVDSLPHYLGFPTSLLCQPHSDIAPASFRYRRPNLFTLSAQSELAITKQLLSRDRDLHFLAKYRYRFSF